MISNIWYCLGERLCSYQLQYICVKMFLKTDIIFFFFCEILLKVNEMCPLRRFLNNPLISNWDQWCLQFLFVLNIFFQIQMFLI